MTKYLVANFKQNLNLSQLSSWLTHFTAKYVPVPDVQIIIAGSYIHLPSLNQYRPQLSIASQDISPFESGAHTGQIGLSQLTDFIDYSLVGHSEVRRDHQDTDKNVAIKAKLLLKANITPIICLDLPYLESQIALLKRELLSLDKLIFAYEPNTAIGTGHPDTPQNANQIAFKIKGLTNRSFPVLYGGSVTPDNVHQFTSQEYLNGALVGTASLNPQTFISLVSNV